MKFNSENAILLLLLLSIPIALILGFNVYKLIKFKRLIAKLEDSNSNQMKRIIDLETINAELQKSDRYFKSIVNNSSDLIVISSLEGIIQFASTSFRRTLGYRPEDMVGRSGYDFVHPEDKHELKTKALKAFQNPGRYQVMECKIIARNGKYIYTQIRANLIFDFDKKVNGIFMVMNDITSRKIAEQKQEEFNRNLEQKLNELELSESKFKSIFTRTSDLICLTDINGKLQFISPSIKKMLGYDETELIGKLGYDITHPEDVPYAKEALKLAILNRGFMKVAKVEYRLKRKDGEYIFVEVRPSLIRENNKSTGVILIIQDITERKLKEEKQQDYEKMLESKVEERTHELQLKSQELIAEKQKAEELLLNILPEDTANELRKYGTSKPRTYGMVTVLFTDFKDFTKISEKVVPELLVAEIDHCFSAFDNIVQKYNIEKIKTVGDAYICVAGVPAPRYTHARDAVRVAVEIRDFIERRKNEKIEIGEIPFEIRIGIHSGPVVAGIVGNKKFAYDIWGDTVNLAARMEQNSESGKINISGTTFDLIKDEFNCIYRGKIEAKNKGVIDMYFVE